MNIFTLRDRLIGEYRDYTSSFYQIRDARIRQTVEDAIANGLLWPDALIQLNPALARITAPASRCACIPTKKPRYARRAPAIIMSLPPAPVPARVCRILSRLSITCCGAGQAMAFRRLSSTR